MKFEDIIFPDFDDIAVPPEPNEDSDRGNVLEVDAAAFSFGAACGSKKKNWFRRNCNIVEVWKNYILKFHRQTQKTAISKKVE